jgi:chorismate synthase
MYGIEIVAFTSSIGPEFLFPFTAAHPTTQAANPEFLKLLGSIDRETVDSFVPVRCPHPEAAARMEALVTKFRDAKDSIGGTVTCVIRNVPLGLGEPVFDKLEAKLAHAMMSLPATKGFEIGSGFGGCQMPGSVHNDPFIKAPPPSGTDLNSNIPRPRLTTSTNNSGGIQGGISNGAHIYFNVAFKPPATIGQAQNTAGYDEVEGVLEAKGRHDPCVVYRAIPIVEAMAALVLMDAVMAQKAREGTRDIITEAQRRQGS